MLRELCSMPGWASYVNTIHFMSSGPREDLEHALAVSGSEIDFKMHKNGNCELFVEYCEAEKVCWFVLNTMCGSTSGPLGRIKDPGSLEQLLQWGKMVVNLYYGEEGGLDV